MQHASIAFAGIAALSLLAGCQRHGTGAQAAGAAQAAAQEDAAKQAEAQFADAVAQQNWPVAKAQADILFAQYPGKRVRVKSARAIQPPSSCAQAGRAFLHSQRNVRQGSR